jgi:hypothetical protein
LVDIYGYLLTPMQIKPTFQVPTDSRGDVYSTIGAIGTLL